MGKFKRENLTERQKLAGKESFHTAILGVNDTTDCELQPTLSSTEMIHQCVAPTQRGAVSPTKPVPSPETQKVKKLSCLRTLAVLSSTFILGNLSQCLHSFHKMTPFSCS